MTNLLLTRRSTMSSHTWALLYSMLRAVDREIPKAGRRKQFSDLQIAAMYLWAVAHDRPQCWATERENYSRVFRPRRLPSRSQFNRRIQSGRCQAILEGFSERAATMQVTGVLMMDGRVLRVGPYSQDRDARTGWGAGEYTKGYKLHAIASENGVILACRVLPLNASEKTVAVDLIAQVRPRGLLLADGAYDAGHLYDLVGSFGGQLLTPLPTGAGGGHRRQSPGRLRAAGMWACGEAEHVYRKRDGIERIFSQQSSYGGGLAPLPPWVRGASRVRRWVSAKIAMYHIRLRLREARVA
jgi:transposase